MLKKFVFGTLLFASVILLGYFGHNIHLYGSGICRAENRVLTRQEMIKAAVTYWAVNEEKFNGKVYRLIKSENLPGAINEFLEENPYCCNVNRLPWGHVFLPDVLAGESYYNVTIKYIQGSNEMRPARKYEKTIEMNSCATGLHGTFGEVLD
jgi:hypothetical protein